MKRQMNSLVADFHQQLLASVHVMGAIQGLALSQMYDFGLGQLFVDHDRSAVDFEATVSKVIFELRHYGRS